MHEHFAGLHFLAGLDVHFDYPGQQLGGHRRLVHGTDRADRGLDHGRTPRHDRHERRVPDGTARHGTGVPPGALDLGRELACQRQQQEYDHHGESQAHAGRSQDRPDGDVTRGLLDRHRRHS